MNKNLINGLIFLSLCLSCGGDSGGGGGGGGAEVSTPEAEASNCLLSAEETRLRSILDGMNFVAQATGTTRVRTANEEGSTDFMSYVTDYSFGPEGNLYVLNGTFCDALTAECFDKRKTAEIRNGCFYFDGVQATLQSVSENNVRFDRTLDNGNRVETEFGFNSEQKIFIEEEESSDGNFVSSEEFLEIRVSGD